MIAGDTPILVHNNSCFDPEAEWNALDSYVPGETLGTAHFHGNNGGTTVRGLRNGTSSPTDKALAEAAQAKLRDNGFTMGNAQNPTAWHVEPKVAMYLNGSQSMKAEVVVNHPTGPCATRWGCRDVLNSLLDPGKQLEVHWRNKAGAMQSLCYGACGGWKSRWDA